MTLTEIPGTSAADLATAALGEVGRDPQLALSQADAAVSAARRERDGAAASTAHRAAALAWRELGNLTRAEERGRSGVRSAVRGQAAQHEAEARMSLAFIQLERGRLRAAHHQADLAAAAVTGLPAARVASQRGLILQRSGRLAEALDWYAQALPVFRRHRDRLWEARLLNNRGMLHVDQGNLNQATADFTASGALLRKAGMAALAAGSDWNLGLVAARRGDVPLALSRYDAAQAENVIRGTPNPQLLIDRAEVLLSVGLSGEAQTVAEQALAALADTGQHADLAQATLMLADALAAGGQPTQAQQRALEAESMFVRQQRPSWATLARLTALRATEAMPDGPSARELLTEALRCADDVHRSGWPIAEMEARFIAARAAAELGDTATRNRQLHLASGNRRLGSIDARLRGYYAQALLRDTAGDRRGARAALAAGMRVIDEHQALLGATELRAHVSAIGVDFTAKGLELALLSGDPRSVLLWADRGRARATRPQPVRPPRDPDLTRALAQVRRLQAQTISAQLDGGVKPGIAEQRAAERHVVAMSRKSSGSARTVIDPAAAELAAALGSQVLLEFVEHRGSLSVVAAIDGRFTLHPIGPVSAVREVVDRLHFGLRRMATRFGSERSQQRTRDAVIDDAAGIGAVLLGAVLFGPPAARLADRDVLVVPSAGLHGLPWALLPGLAERPFRVAPSASAWLHAHRDDRVRSSRQVFVAGPGLPNAATEVAELAGRTADAALFTAGNAVAEDVLRSLDGAGLAHIAAHGQLRTDNPLFSALLMDDGPLTVYDIEGLHVAPQTVVLSSCESGVSAATAGDELLGLVAALISIGTRSVVATGIATPDAPTAALMLQLHTGLRAGLSPAAALCEARAATDTTDPAAVATAAGFVSYGA